MSKLSKVIIGVLIVAVIVAISIYLFVYDSVDGLQSSIRKESIVVFAESQDTIYIQAANWGLTGDHIQIVISGQSMNGRGLNTATDYVYYEPTIFYKKDKDTIITYSLSKAIEPSNFGPDINVRQVILKGTEEMKNYEQSYLSLGLVKVSVY